jgi:hypothetical protein
MDSLKLKKNWGNNIGYRPLNYRYKTIIKFKRNGKKLIDGWDVKIEENWGKINWEDPFSWNTVKQTIYSMVEL